MQIIEKVVESVRTGAELSFKNLGVTPLVSANDEGPDYMTLDEALSAGTARVTETSEAGNVPELQFENQDEKAVLLLDGEELVGAKQNRVLNLTILVPAKSTIIIPVSCVEAGRWAHAGKEFSTRGRAYYATGRARKVNQVTESLRVSGTRRSRQAEVWDDIEQMSMRLNSRSATSAMASMYEDYEEQVEAYVETIELTAGQVGAVFCINGQIRGMELFDFTSTYQKLAAKLIRSYALDAIDQLESAPIEGTLDIPGFLKAVANADGTVHPAVGEGEDIRIDGSALAGGALQVKDRIVHLCAFHLVENGSTGARSRSNISNPSRRAMYHRHRRDSQ